MLEITNKNNNKNKMFHTIILNLIVSVTFLFLVINSPAAESNLIKVYAQQQQQQNQASPNSPIVLTAKMIDNQYRWIDTNTNAINPTLNVTAGIDNEITVKSLEGDSAEHELVIEGVSSNDVAASGNDDDDKDNDKGGGEELVKSDEIKEGSSATVNFNSAEIQEDDDNSNYQSFEYYCEYHPDTMRGKIQIK